MVELQEVGCFFSRIPVAGFSQPRFVSPVSEGFWLTRPVCDIPCRRVVVEAQMGVLWRSRRSVGGSFRCGCCWENSDTDSPVVVRSVQRRPANGAPLRLWFPDWPVAPVVVVPPDSLPRGLVPGSSRIPGFWSWLCPPVLGGRMFSVPKPFDRVPTGLFGRRSARCFCARRQVVPR